MPRLQESTSVPLIRDNVFVRRHMSAVAKGEISPLQALKNVELFGIRTKVAQRVFLRLAVHENARAIADEQDSSVDASQRLLDASRAIQQAFEHLNKEDPLLPYRWE